MLRLRGEAKVPGFTQLEIEPGKMIEHLIQLTLDQAKARGLAGDDLKDIRRSHDQLRKSLGELKDLLFGPPDSTTAQRIIFTFELATILAYVLRSESPLPKWEPIDRTRVEKALKARTQGWEKPVEEAIAEAFKTMEPDTSNDIIIRYVRAEMKRRKIKYLSPKMTLTAFCASVS
jgi:hypothetical protein